MAPLSLLRRSPLLRSLPPKDLRRVLRIARLISFSEGATIFSKSDLANQMFIVAAGRVKIFAVSGGKKRKTFAYLGPGDFFGEMALLDGRDRSASAQAVSDTRLLVIHKRDFRRMLLSDPKLTYYLLRRVSERLRRANEEIEGLLFRNVLGRVSKALVDLASQNSRRFRGGLLIGAHYTHQELADMIGTSREPLSRALAVLRRAELLDTRHGNIFLRDPKRMRALAGEVAVR